MSGEHSQNIQITHVVNPHLFWYKLKNNPDHVADAIERELGKYVSENREKMCAAKSNGSYLCEVYVAVFMISQRKWVRAEIHVKDETVANNEIIVWAIDYGFPLKTALDSVVLLSNELKKKCYTLQPAVHKGGIIDIYPASIRVNTSNVVRKVVKEKWDLKSAKTMTDMMASPIEFHFLPVFETNGHVFGSLDIHLSGKIRSVSDILADGLKLGLKVSSDIFRRDISKLMTMKIDCWLNNDGGLNCIENKEVVIEGRQPEPQSSADTMPMLSNDSRLIDQHEIVRRHVPRIRVAANKNKADEENRLNVRTSASTSQTSSNPVASAKSHIKRETLVEISKNRAPTTQPIQSKALPSKTIAISDIQPNGVINKLKLVRILVRNNELEPVEMKCANFTDAVFKGLKHMNLQETYASQGYAWPNLLRGNPLVLVDSQKRGKTVAYLPAVCSTVLRELDRQEKATMGATAIIVCLTAQVPEIARMCRDLLQIHHYKSHVVEAVGQRDTVSVTVKLYNGCNILVTTAPCLKELLTKSANAIKNEKLKCIAFENLDCIMKKHADICNDIIKELCVKKGDVRQIIVTSRTWKPFLGKFMNEKVMAADSVLIIGNYLEAALWGGVSLEFILSKAEDKLANLTKQIKKVPVRTERTLVICNEFEEAKTVVKHLQGMKIPTELVQDNEFEYYAKKVESFWTNMEGVLVCADKQLKGTTIMNAQNIIHFSIPTQDYRLFLFRFSAMINSFSDGSSSSTEKRKAESTVLIDNNNIRQLPKFVDLLLRDGQQVPKELMELSERARMQNTEERAKDLRFEPICNFVFMHGTSEHRNECRMRHKLVSTDILDEKTNQIQPGTLRFHIINIISPTEYIVRPVSFQTDDNKWHPMAGSDEFVCLDTKIQQFYRNSNNPKRLIVLALGEKCVVEKLDKFYRGEIIKMYPKRNPTDVERCDVRYLDTGAIHEHQALDAYALDESFQTVPNQAYSLHLTGVIPADKEDDWDPRVHDQVTKELNKWTEKENNIIYEANVLFSLRNTIVVDIMRLVNLSRGVVHCSLKTFLSKKCHGLLDSNSRKNVIDMAKNEGVKIPKRSRPIAKKPNEMEMRGEQPGGEQVGILQNLKDDSAESYEEETNENWACPWKAQHKSIEISLFHNPSNFFVTQKSEQLRKLYDAVNEYVHEKIETSMDDSMNDPDIDKYCLVKMPEASSDRVYYNRGKIFEAAFDENDCIVKVFLVDIGEIVSTDCCNVFEIPDHLIEMLPFQAIWCNMVGIMSQHKGTNEVEWTEQQIDEIYNAIDEYGDQLFLHTVSTDKSIESNITDTKIFRHDVALLAVRDQQQINVNELVVSLDLAEYDPETMGKLQNVPSLLDDDNNDDSDEDWDQEISEYQAPNWVHLNAPQDNDDPNQNDTESKLEMFDNFDAEDCIEFFKLAMQNGGSSTPAPASKLNRIDEINEEGEEQPKPEPKEPLNVIGADAGYGSEDTVTEESTCENISDSHQLEYIHKRPQVHWWQTEEMLVLRISAHENVQYGLEVTPEHLIYGTKNNEEDLVAVINFFGTVETGVVTHEIRGLNVIVRLRKSFPIMWPRLLYTAEKCSWVIQNLELFKDEEASGYDKDTDIGINAASGTDSDDDEDNMMHPSEEEDFLSIDDDRIGNALL